MLKLWASLAFTIKSTLIIIQRLSPLMNAARYSPVSTSKDQLRDAADDATACVWSKVLTERLILLSFLGKENNNLTFGKDNLLMRRYA